MRGISAAALTLIALSTLTACGGGGGGAGGGGDSSSSTATTRYSETDIKTTAQLGASVGELTDRYIPTIGAFAAAFLQQISFDNGGSRIQTSFSCAINGAGSGSATASFSKSAVRMGLASGDSVTVVYNNCDLGGTGLMLDGTWKMTALSPIINQPSVGYQVNFESSFTGFTLRDRSSSVRLIGTTNFMGLDILGTASTFTVAQGQVLEAIVTNSGGTISMAYPAGTSFSTFVSSTAVTGTRKLDGWVSVAASGRSIDILVATPTILTGNLNTTGRLTPFSGETSTKMEDLQTSLSISGDTITVSGDSDGNGSLDLVFFTTWAGLLEI